jgi:hypothetical protein
MASLNDGAHAKGRKFSLDQMPTDIVRQMQSPFTEGPSWSEAAADKEIHIGNKFNYSQIKKDAVPLCAHQLK